MDFRLRLRYGFPGMAASDPYEYFRFRLQWEGKAVAGLRACAMSKGAPGAQSDNEVGAGFSAGRPKFDAVELDRGVTYDSDFRQWASLAPAFSAGLRSGVALREFRKDIVLAIYNESGRLAIAYRLFGCLVSEFQAAPSPATRSNAILIEHIRLENEGWEIETLETEPQESEESIPGYFDQDLS